ncbi:MAG: hypothetical protein E5X72_13470 [Mesorhizobium sp.]|nr:MAG: hypothetical protein E5X72_13470 [Mesorhizobium sp.]
MRIDQRGPGAEARAAIAESQRIGVGGRGHADRLERILVGGSIDMQLAGGGSGAETDIAVRGNVEAARGRARPDAERQQAAIRGVAYEEIRLVAADVPCLRREAAGVCLLKADRRRVASGYLQAESRVGRAEAQIARAVDIDRILGSARIDAEHHLVVRRILDAKVVGAAGDGIVRNQRPVIGGKSGGRARVVEVDACVVFLHDDRVEPEGLVVDAVEPDAEASLNDLVVRNDIVG